MKKGAYPEGLFFSKHWWYPVSHSTVYAVMSSIYYFSHEMRTKPELLAKNDHRSKFFSLSNWKEEAWKNHGFNGIRARDLRDTGAMLYQLSYEATHWERGQFIEFISPVQWNAVKYIWNNSRIISYIYFTKPKLV